MTDLTDAFDRVKSALADRYTIERELGHGGMATVYLAEDLKHHRKVAVKVLRPELAAALGAERFHREIEIAANLNHPHILPLLDSGTAEEQPTAEDPTALPPYRPTAFLYYVMPYVEGQSLREKLANEGELPISEAVRILRDVVEALSHAHKHNVVHRDIKPDNVLLSEHHALVTDFGVAKAVSDATGAIGLTTEGVALGTPAYMSPEQASADPHIDHRADIYAVGVIAYELLTGRTPFVGNTQQELLAAHVTQTPEPVTKYRESVPPALAGLVMKCLEKKAADRWQTAEELLPQLEALATPSGGVTPTGMMPVGAAWRGWKVVAVVGAVALVLAVILVTTLLPRGSGVVLDPERIVVAVFRNETGDPSLDFLGRQAGHGITQGIRAGGDFVRFTPWEVALQSSMYVQSEADAGRVRDVIRALGEETGSGTVISGAYYLDREEVRFQVDVTDAVGRTLIGSPEAVIGAREAPSELVGQLQQRVMGFLAMTFDERFATSARQIGRLPTFEAYQAFDAGMEELLRYQDDEATLRHFLRAFELDSTFYTALVYASLAHLNAGDVPQTDTLLQVMASHADQLSEYDRHWMHALRAYIDGDHETALRAITAAAQIAPQSRAAYLRAWRLECLNRPREELEVLAGIDPERGGMRGNFLYWARVAGAHSMLGEYSQMLEAARRGRERYPDVPAFPYIEMSALIALDRVDDAMEILTEPEEQVAIGYAYSVGVELRIHGHAEAAREAFDQAIELLRALPSEEAAQAGAKYALASALYNAGEWAEALDIAEVLAAEFPDDLNYVGLLGVTAARLGDRETALLMSERLGAMEKRWIRDFYAEWRARISVALGEHSEAVRILQEAFSQRWIHLSTQTRNVDLAELRDRPDFQELMRPKG